MNVTKSSGKLEILVGKATGLPLGFQGVVEIVFGDRQRDTTTRAGAPSVSWNEKLEFATTFDVSEGGSVIAIAKSAQPTSTPVVTLRTSGAASCEPLRFSQPLMLASQFKSGVWQTVALPMGRGIMLTMEITPQTSIATLAAPGESSSGKVSPLTLRDINDSPTFAILNNAISGGTATTTSSSNSDTKPKPLTSLGSASDLLKRTPMMQSMVLPASTSGSSISSAMGGHAFSPTSSSSGAGAAARSSPLVVVSSSSAPRSASATNLSVFTSGGITMMAERSPPPSPSLGGRAPSSRTLERSGSMSGRKGSMLIHDTSKSTDGFVAQPDGTWVKKEYYKITATPQQQAVDRIMTQLKANLTQQELWDLHLFLLHLENELTSEAAKWAQTFMEPFESICSECEQKPAWELLISLLLQCLRSVLKQVQDRLTLVQSESQHRLADAHEEIERLRTDNTRLEAEAKNLLGHKADLETQLRQLVDRPTSEMLERARSEAIRYRCHAEQLEVQMKTAADTHAHERTLDKNILDGLRQEVQTLRSDLQKETARSSHLEQQLGSAQSTSAMTIESLRNELLRERMRAEQADQQLAGLQTTTGLTLENTQAELSRQRTRNESLEQQLRSLKTSSATTLETLKADLARLEQQLKIQQDRANEAAETAALDLSREQARAQFFEEQLRIIQDKTSESTETMRAELARERTKAEHLELQLKSFEDIKAELTRERTRAEHLDLQLRRLDDTPAALETARNELIKERARNDHLEWQLKLMNERPAPEIIDALKAELNHEREKVIALAAQLADMKDRPAPTEMDALRVQWETEMKRADHLEAQMKVLLERPTTDELVRERSRASQLEIQLQMIQQIVERDLEPTRAALREEREQSTQMRTRLDSLLAERELYMSTSTSETRRQIDMIKQLETRLLELTDSSTRMESDYMRRIAQLEFQLEQAVQAAKEETNRRLYLQSSNAVCANRMWNLETELQTQRGGPHLPPTAVVNVSREEAKFIPPQPVPLASPYASSITGTDAHSSFQSLSGHAVGVGVGGFVELFVSLATPRPVSPHLRMTVSVNQAGVAQRHVANVSPTFDAAGPAPVLSSDAAAQAFRQTQFGVPIRPRTPSAPNTTTSATASTTVAYTIRTGGVSGFGVGAAPTPLPRSGTPTSTHRPPPQPTDAQPHPITEPILYMHDGVASTRRPLPSVVLPSMGASAGPARTPSPKRKEM